jgi:hypothetical protein
LGHFFTQGPFRFFQSLFKGLQTGEKGLSNRASGAQMKKRRKNEKDKSNKEDDPNGHVRQRRHETSFLFVDPWNLPDNEEEPG